MKVYLDEYGSHGDGEDVIAVDLDDGTHVSAWCIVANGEEERALLEKHLTMVRDEATAASNKIAEAWKAAQRATDACLFSRKQKQLLMNEMISAVEYAQKLEQEAGRGQR